MKKQINFFKTYFFFLDYKKIGSVFNKDEYKDLEQHLLFEGVLEGDINLDDYNKYSTQKISIQTLKEFKKFYKTCDKYYLILLSKNKVDLPNEFSKEFINSFFNYYKPHIKEKLINYFKKQKEIKKQELYEEIKKIYLNLRNKYDEDKIFEKIVKFYIDYFYLSDIKKTFQKVKNETKRLPKKDN